MAISFGTYNAEIEFSYQGFIIDLNIYHNQRVYLFEMKNWVKEATTGLRSDVFRLRNFPDTGYFLIFSRNPKEMTDENLKLISLDLSLPSTNATHRFMTEDRNGASVEFWFGGWHVPPIG